MDPRFYKGRKFFKNVKRLLKNLRIVLQAKNVNLKMPYHKMYIHPHAQTQIHIFIKPLIRS